MKLTIKTFVISTILFWGANHAFAQSGTSSEDIKHYSSHNYSVAIETTKVVLPTSSVSIATEKGYCDVRVDAEIICYTHDGDRCLINAINLAKAKKHENKVVITYDSNSQCNLDEHVRHKSQDRGINENAAH